jgi:hypothetical protein
MTAQPSPEFRTHHDVAAPRVDASAFRQGWKVDWRLDQLHAVGAIDAATWSSGVQFRQDWERAFGRGRVGPLVALPGGGGANTEHDRQIDRLAALDRLGLAATHLGGFWTKLVEHCAVDDLSWAEIARLHNVTPPTARAWTIRALNRLADLTGTPHTARKASDVVQLRPNRDAV